MAQIRNITLGEIQERNFHQDYMGGIDPNYESCDVDWVRFVPPCNATLNIETSHISGWGADANTRLTLFDANLVQLAQNDDISGTNLFSRISWNFTGGLIYFIRAENMSPGVTGYYGLQVGNLSISGSSHICNTANTYSIIDLPPGATVTWSSIPAGAVSFNPAGPTTSPSTQATRLQNGNITIQAIINNCGPQIILSIPVVAGPPEITNGTYFTNGQELPLQLWTGNNNSDNNVCNLELSNTNMQIQRASSVTWSKISSVPNHPVGWLQNGDNLSFYLTSVNQRVLFRITASNSCGNVSADYRFKSIECGEPCFNFRISPNPVKTQAKVIPNIPPPCFSITGKGNKKVVERNGNGAFQIRILDNRGYIRRVQRENTLSYTTLNLAGLVPGVYFVELSDGQTKEVHKIIVQH
jgi:Secretion system C-terminal sorting domain